MELPKYIEPKKELNQTDLMMLEIESRRECCTFVDKSLRFSVEVCKLDPFIPSPKDFMKELRKIIKKHENEYRG